MAEINDIRKGVVINYNNELYVVTFFQFTNPGKGSAFTKCKMKSITSSKTVDVTFKSAEKVDIVQVDRGNLQYLYRAGDLFAFMNKNSYETFEIGEDIVGDDAKYLKDDMEVMGTYYQGALIAIELPKKVIYHVAEASPAVKGDSVSGNVTKSVTLENGLQVQVPIFIKEGEDVIINTETGDYCGRSNE
jgi:elongation factor P